RTYSGSTGSPITARNSSRTPAATRSASYQSTDSNADTCPYCVVSDGTNTRNASAATAPRDTSNDAQNAASSSVASVATAACWSRSRLAADAVTTGGLLPLHPRTLPCRVDDSLRRRPSLLTRQLRLRPLDLLVIHPEQLHADLSVPQVLRASRDDLRARVRERLRARQRRVAPLHRQVHHLRRRRRQTVPHHHDVLEHAPQLGPVDHLLHHRDVEVVLTCDDLRVRGLRVVRHDAQRRQRDARVPRELRRERPVDRDVRLRRLRRDLLELRQLPVVVPGDQVQTTHHPVPHRDRVVVLVAER